MNWQRHVLRASWKDVEQKTLEQKIIYCYVVFTELVSNYQKTESLGLTDRYGYAYSPVLENGREGWANFTGDWNMGNRKECTE